MGFSLWHLLIVLLIVVVLFGTKRLRSIGADLGGAVKGFRDSMGDNKAEDKHALDHADTQRNIDAKAEAKDKDRT